MGEDIIGRTGRGTSGDVSINPNKLIINWKDYESAVRSLLSVVQGEVKERMGNVVGNLASGKY